jgi:hypothetical protein
MDTKNFFFVAISKVNVEMINGVPYPRGVFIGLETSGNMEREKYYSSPGVFNKHGSAMYTRTAIDGLVANLQVAHQQGWRDSAEHLRFIIEEITKGFAEAHQTARVEKQTIKAKDPEYEKKRHEGNMG